MATTEELLISKIENNLRGLRLKTKTIAQVNTEIETRLVRLRYINPHMADELELKFYKEKSKLKK